MGALRTAIDNCVTALQGATIRGAVTAADLVKIDAAIANFTTARASVPNNDLLSNLTPAQRRAIDQTLSAILKTFDDGDGQSIDSRSGLPPAVFYDRLDAVCEIRDQCRAA
jgi:hypothetical protein